LRARLKLIMNMGKGPWALETPAQARTKRRLRLGFLGWTFLIVGGSFITPAVVESYYHARIEGGAYKGYGSTMLFCLLAGTFATIFPRKGWWFLLIPLNLLHFAAGLLLLPWK
jgi:hypothetical protein